MDRLVRVGRDAGQRRGHVRRLGVVHVADAADLGHELEPVRDAGERAQRIGDLLLRGAQDASGGGRRSCVLAIVPARDQRLRGQRIVRVELRAGQTGAARHDGGARPLEDPQLRGAVRFERAVPIEVVRLEVQQHRDPRPELVDVLELKRGQLDDDELLRLDLAVELRQRPTHVSRHRCAEHEAQPFGCRRLPVGASDSNDWIRKQPGGEFDLAPDGHAAFAGRGDEWSLGRHPRALDQQPDALEQQAVVLVRELPVGPHDLHPAPLERSGRREPRPREPEHENASRQPVQRNPRK